MNTASRLESHGLPGEIHVSGETRALLGDTHELASRGRVVLKGLGERETWLLMAPKPQATSADRSP